MELRSRRLILRPVRVADLTAVHAMWTNSEVRRFLFDDRCISPSEAQALIESSEAKFQETRFGVWLACGEGSEAPRGFAGLLASTGGPPNLIIGMEPASWGQGLATEAGQAVLDHAFGALGLPEVVADVDEPNARSIRMLERLGMTFRRRALVNGRPLLYYGLSRKH